MSAIGRIFLVLNLILSALFLGWATQVLQQSDEWRAKYEASQTELASTTESLEAESDALSSQLKQAEARTSSVVDERDGFEQQASGLTNDLTTERGRFTTLQGDVTVLTQNLGDLTSQLGSLESAKDAAVASARGAESDRDDAVSARMTADTARMGLKDDLDKANIMIADLETSLHAAKKTVSRQDAQLATIIDEYSIDISKLLDQPLVNGTVLSVKSVEGINLVALNVGKNDMVKRGMTFQIWSGGTYKGEVRVDNVQPNMCSALVTNLVNASAPMVEGDNAATRL